MFKDRSQCKYSGIKSQDEKIGGTIAVIQDVTEQNKLENMRVVAAYPDTMGSVWDMVDVKGTAEGGTAFSNYAAYLKAAMARSAEELKHPLDKQQCLFDSAQTYVVNAYFNNSLNILYFPAGILQTPFYSPEASLEANMGGIGAVIGHELTHAFDNSGAQYDANGNAADWWQEADYAAFEALVDDVINYYDGFEFAPGLPNISAQTVGENIADLGGVSIALEYLERQLAAPDYDEFFRSYAKSWADIYSRQFCERVAVGDVHSAPWVRINAVLPVFEQFYQQYQISEGDGLYVAPEDRVKIW
jgi:putative endopeptidase